MYVGDTGTNVVSKFSASGAYISANDGSSADAPVAGPFGALAGVTVDGSGNLWVYDSNGSMFEFAQNASFVTDWSSGRGVNPAGIDADGAGSLYVLTAGGNVEQFTATGTDVGSVNGDAFDPTGLALDRSSNDVYMDSGGLLVRHYPASCGPGGNCTAADAFGSGHLSAAAGLAVDPSNGTVYAASALAGQIQVFTGPVTLPDVSTNTPSDLHGTTVTLSGHVDPAGGGSITSCRFEYGTDTSYGQSTACSPAAPYSNPADVSADLSGLSPDTVYHFRLDAGDAQGENQGVDQTFTTLGAIIDGLSVANVSAHGVSLQAQVDPNGQDTVYHFEYVDQTSFQASGFSGASSVPVPDEDLGAGPGGQPVTQDISGLALGTQYHYRVIATNSDGTTVSAPQTFSTLPAVQIGATSARDVTSSSATLDGQVNPDGIASTYRFQYVDDASFRTSGYSTAMSVPVPDGDLAAAIGDVSVSQHLQGLHQEVSYHYRLVAANAAAPAGENGADHTFTTQAATGGTVVLPDDRRYELVTPAIKGDGTLDAVQVGTSPTEVQASTSGDKLAYISTTPFPGSQAGVAGFYLGSRGSSGWSFQALNPPQARTSDLANTPLFTAYSLDLSKGILLDGGGAGQSAQDAPPLVSGEPSNVQNVFVRDNFTNSYQLANITPPGVSPERAAFENASADLSHVIFASGAQLTPDALPGAHGARNLYQWVGGVVSLVGQIPAMPATRCGGQDAPCVAPDGGTDLGAGYLQDPGFVGAVSTDGSKVFFELTSHLTPQTGQLYVREDGIRTVEYSASQKTNGTGPGGADAKGPRAAQYWAASADGSKVFFSSCEQLTNNSTASAPAGDGCIDEGAPIGQDLYEYNTATGHLTDLTVDHNNSTNGADVQGVLGASADGSYVYYVANGVVANGASPGDCTVQISSGSGLDPDASCSLYVAHGGATKFIATLSAQDYPDWNGPFAARVTPDGTHLAFNSTRSLTGSDNVPAVASDCAINPVSGQSATTCDEVYLYSADTGLLVCASCNPSGARPTGSASIPSVPISEVITGKVFPYLRRNLSADGGRLFFNSQDTLVPGDSNGRQDVYEYEGGRPHLISSGTSNADSEFVDASLSGDDAFFKTSAPLVPQDVDQSLDIYDARVGGGFPFSPPAAACVGEACRPPAAGAVAGVNPGSTTFVGPGDTPLPGQASAAGIRVRVTAKAGRGSQLTLRLSVPGRGRVDVTGSGVKALSRSLSRAGKYRIVLRRSTAERRALKRKRKVRLTVHVRFLPVAGRASATTASITDKA
ncbi:MAG TPA: hypothetical protein VLJ42_05590 [Solirubrobacteraceae bacterium]|nr:hypothetical protein [Solirubrobacteraceae bacterium]